MWICAMGDYCEPVHDEPPALKPLVREVLGQPVRRIDRFIELALIGAGRCVGGEWLPRGTGVYTSSARGDLQVTLDVVEPLFREGQVPKPLSFVNTVSNATNFYVARHFELEGPSNSVSHLRFAFESALELAVMDMETGRIDSALVGSVDVVTAPVTEHRQRLGLTEDTVVAEGSHWAWLRVGKRPAGALAQLLTVRQFGRPAEFTDWLAATPLPRDTSLLVSDSAPLDDIESRAGLALCAPAPGPGYYGSRSGATLGEFLRRFQEEYLLHVNAEPGGDRLAVMLARRL